MGGMDKGQWAKGRAPALWLLLAAGLRPAVNALHSCLFAGGACHVSRVRNSRNSG